VIILVSQNKTSQINHSDGMVLIMKQSVFFHHFMNFFIKILFINIDASRKFKAIQSWWQDMAERNGLNKQAASNLKGSKITECSTNIKTGNC